MKYFYGLGQFWLSLFVLLNSSKIMNKGITSSFHIHVLLAADCIVFLY